MSAERVLTLASKEDRGGVYISKFHYDRLSEFILSELEDKKDVPLSSLLEEAGRQFADFTGGDLSWHFLRVKYDLEAKGLITSKIQRQPQRTQLLTRVKKSTVRNLFM